MILGRREGQTLEYEELLQAARDAEVEWTETGAKPKPPKGSKDGYLQG